ncbi:MAG TPA: membrane protein insertase YidC [Puia sp.]|nr:membrane protein insertase YidC [Puia sp.]
MDRNTVIGFVLMGILLFLYLFISTKNSQDYEKQKKHYDDSVKLVRAHQDSIARLQDTAKNKVYVVADTTGVHKAMVGSEQLLTVRNNVMTIVFTNKGGQPKEVELVKFQSYDKTPVKVLNPASENHFSYAINAGNQSAQIADLFFNAGKLTKNADGSQTVEFSLPASGGESLVHQFTIRPDDYMIDWNVKVENTSQLFAGGNLNFNWHYEPMRAQQTASYEKRQTNISYYQDNNFDYISRKTEADFNKSVQWLAVSQQFFNTTLVAKNNFSSGSVKWARELSDSSNLLAKVDAGFQSKLPSGNAAVIPFQVYYGPNNYTVLKNEPVEGMAKIIDLGRGFYSFVRPINVYLVMPVFDFFKKFIASYGIVIMLLTIVIRVVTSPLVYSSYLSGAKMKALRPEIDEMKKRVGDDQQRASMEQMKLFREAGVNPLGGCIPALLQIPIFFALYSFFNSTIELRNQSFLWAKDLSAFDSILSYGFNIPLYGDHVSLFGLLASATNFIISLYGMSMTTPDQNNPAMKYMPYIMPIMFLFFFNNLPSALTWYYTVSNIITLALQFVIQNYIIDHDKILAKLQANRNKPKSKPKWQERFEQMQESQKKLDQMKNKK